MFFRGSRYADASEHQITDNQGRVIRYKRIRFIPETAAQFGHKVSQGERLDLVAFQAFRNPERFWRICDANDALWPPDLVAEPGRIIRIPRSEG